MSILMVMAAIALTPIYTIMSAKFFNDLLYLIKVGVLEGLATHEAGHLIAAKRMPHITGIDSAFIKGNRGAVNYVYLTNHPGGGWLDTIVCMAGFAAEHYKHGHAGIDVFSTDFAHAIEQMDWEQTHNYFRFTIDVPVVFMYLWYHFGNFSMAVSATKYIMAAYFAAYALIDADADRFERYRQALLEHRTLSGQDIENVS